MGLDTSKYKMTLALKAYILVWVSRTGLPHKGNMYSTPYTV